MDNHHDFAPKQMREIENDLIASRIIMSPV